MSQTSIKSVPESDNEFWADLSICPTLQRSLEEIPLIPVNKIASFQELPQDSSRQVDRLHKQIETLRTAKEVEVKNAEIVLRRNLQREFDLKFEKVKEEFSVKHDNLLRELDDLKITLHKKSGMIDSMSQVLHDLELFVTQYRICRVSARYSRPSKTNIQGPFATSQDKNLAKDDAKQESSIKMVCAMYARDADEAKQECKKAQEKLKRVIKQFELEKVEIQRQAKQGEIDLREALENEKNKFKLFVEECETELELREALNDKQLKLILALQDELKSAKTILLSPRLRNKTIEHLRSLSSSDEGKQSQLSRKTPITLHKIEERRPPKELVMRNTTPKGTTMPALRQSLQLSFS
mmetsp:Transcript_12320/g.23386  ORF Transcript_12320/g.23386 Transcript_12320/m.23386 type:complete len:353 (-) Transcript_12320:28-1086(-)